jgi:aminopeptidase N
LDDALLRQQVWSTLWDMVRDGSLRATGFLAAVGRFAPRETDRGLVSVVLERATTTLSRYLPEGLADEASGDLVSTALGVVSSARDPDLRIVWLRAAIAAAARPADVARLLRLMDGESSVEGVSLDQEMRWSLAVAAVAHDLEGAAERLDVEAARDRSDRGVRSVLRARSARPDPASKAATWERIHGQGFGSDHLTRAAIAGFQWPHQRELLLRFREPFFAALRGVFATRDHAFARSYLSGLVPDRWGEPEVAERLHLLADGLEPHERLLRRHLAEVTDDLERAIRVRAVAVDGDG